MPVFHASATGKKNIPVHPGFLEAPFLYNMTLYCLSWLLTGMLGRLSAMFWDADVS